MPYYTTAQQNTSAFDVNISILQRDAEQRVSLLRHIQPSQDTSSSSFLSLKKCNGLTDDQYNLLDNPSIPGSYIFIIYLPVPVRPTTKQINQYTNNGDKTLYRNLQSQSTNVRVSSEDFQQIMLYDRAENTNHKGHSSSFVRMSVLRQNFKK